MQEKEEKICSFQQKNTRLQLIKLTKKEDIILQEWQIKEYGEVVTDIRIKYQVRLNRKVIKTSISEYEMRKLFATYAQNIILQLKIY